MDAELKAYLDKSIEGVRTEHKLLTELAASIGKGADEALKMHIDNQKSASDTSVKNLSELMRERDKAVVMVKEVSEANLKKAAEAVEKRLAEMNEMRAQITDERAEFAKKAEVDGRFDRLQVQVHSIEDGIALGQKPNWVLVLGILSLMTILMGGGWTLLELKTENAIAPFRVQLAQAQDDRSRLERDLEILRVNGSQPLRDRLTIIEVKMGMKPFTPTP